MTVAIIVVLLVLAVGFFFIDKTKQAADDKAWEAYVSNETSQTQRILSRAARPIASLPILQNQVKATQTYKQLTAKLRAGGAYAGSLEVYLSVQVVTILLGIGIIGLAALLGLTGLPLYLSIAFGLLFMILPLNKVFSTAKARSVAVTESLPDFAELLIMVLPNSSILTALAFTAERSKGPVAEEITSMVSAISSRSLNEAEAFQLAAERLGTPEARAFMTTLMNAYLEGAKALDAIKAQSESMRKLAFQHRRELAKKLPTKLSIIYGIHFMPALLVIAFLPIGLGLGDALG